MQDEQSGYIDTNDAMMLTTRYRPEIPETVSVEVTTDRAPV